MRYLCTPTLIFCLIASTSAMSRATILVGRDSTVDGSTIIARNDDSGSAFNPCVMFKHRANPQPYKFVSNPEPGQNVTNNTFTLQMPAHTLAYQAHPRLNTLTSTSLSFEETGINSYNVAISATETIFNSPQVLRVDDYPVNGIREDGITSVILPQATSARHGIDLLG